MQRTEPARSISLSICMLTRHLRADVVMLLGLLLGDTRTSTPKLESCLVAMVHEAPSKRDRCKTETGQDSPLASRWSRACKSSDRQAVASLLDMCSRKSRLRSSVPRMSGTTPLHRRVLP
ncbi:hypothetical protein BZA70DRAFT_271827 [Myxozyma melibiosi]|uniref:Secreted protein n=1 Tax=Myxozyma melibiosi TaxID=54550 RepID=A0ABR1FCQ6_9ASCO